MSTHEILELRLVIKNSLLYSLLTAIISALYLILAQIATVFVSILIPKATLVVSYTFVMFTLLVIAPLRNKLQWFLDSYIFQDKYNHQHVLNELFSIIPYITEKNKLIPSVLSLIKKNLKSKEIILILPKDTPPIYVLSKAEGFSTISHSPFTSKSALFNFLSSNKNMEVINVNHASITGKKIYTTIMEELKLVDFMHPSFILPLRSEKLIGILLVGDKENGRFYNDEEIEIIKVIGRELTVCLERLNTLDEKSRKKGENLKKAADNHRISDLKNSLRVMQDLQREFEKNAKRQILKDMVDKEITRLEDNIKRLSGNRGKKGK